MIEHIDWAWDEIAYFQIGDIPGRKEPGTGEMNYRNIFKHIAREGGAVEPGLRVRHGARQRSARQGRRAQAHRRLRRRRSASDAQRGFTMTTSHGDADRHAAGAGGSGLRHGRRGRLARCSRPTLLTIQRTSPEDVQVRARSSSAWTGRRIGTLLLRPAGRRGKSRQDGTRCAPTTRWSGRRWNSTPSRARTCITPA